MINAKYREDVTRIFIGILAMVYLSSLSVSTLHSYFAHTKVVQEVCTLDDEKDPCHRSIYHQDTKKGCEHESHLIVPIVDCDQCLDIIPNHVSDYKTYHVNSFDYKSLLVIRFSSQVYFKDCVRDNFLRGPPC